MRATKGGPCVRRWILRFTTPFDELTFLLYCCSYNNDQFYHSYLYTDWYVLYDWYVWHSHVRKNVQPRTQGGILQLQEWIMCLALQPVSLSLWSIPHSGFKLVFIQESWWVYNLRRLQLVSAARSFHPRPLAILPSACHDLTFQVVWRECLFLLSYDARPPPRHMHAFLSSARHSFFGLMCLCLCVCGGRGRGWLSSL